VVDNEPAEVVAADVFDFLAHQRGDRTVIRLSDGRPSLNFYDAWVNLPLSGRTGPGRRANRSASLFRRNAFSRARPVGSR
jgi:hypothetical protein